MAPKRWKSSPACNRLKSKPETAGVPIIIVAYKAGGFDETEKRADFAIYKDINIEAQLAKALDALAGKAGKSHSAGK